MFAIGSFSLFYTAENININIPASVVIADSRGKQSNIVRTESLRTTGIRDREKIEPSTSYEYLEVMSVIGYLI